MGIARTHLPQPPKIKKVAKNITINGDVRKDPYAWLQKNDDPVVKQKLKEENTYADAIMRPTARLQKGLYREIRGRMTEDDRSVPVKDGAYFYYARTRKGKQYAIHCRMRGAKGAEEVILDENRLARGHRFFSLGAGEVSPDHSLMAYTTDVAGNEQYTLRIKNLATGKILPDRIESVESVVWAEDGTHFFYTKEQHPFPPRQVFLHALGTHPSEDVLIYEEQDPQWSVTLDKTRSKKYIFINASNFDTSEVRFIPTDAPHTKPTLIARRKKKVLYALEHHSDYFYISTNERAANFKIMRTLTSEPGKKYWKEWLAYNEKRAITDMMASKDFITITLRENGTEQLYICRKPSAVAHLEQIVFSEDQYTLTVSDETEYDAPFIRIVYQSFVTPRKVFDYYVDSGRCVVRKKQHVPKWHPKKYVTERVWARSGGVRVPISLVYRADLPRDGSTPLLLDSYGSYGIVNDPTFSLSRISLLERGWVIAIAHPRGGGEMGWTWHKQAQKTTKHRTYHDLIACADFLVRRSYTSHTRLVMTGGSAGGMSLGAVLNMRPDICAAAVVRVPNADVVTSMLDTSLGGTMLHYDELGNPRKPREYFYLKKWSPYENIHDAAYPALLVRCSLNDIRTPYWESAKWVARLREHTNDNPILLKTELSAGHAGKSGRYEWIKNVAYDYAFMLAQVERS